jgi:hypothetical protein
MADSENTENTENTENIEEKILKQINPGLLCKYMILSILIGIIFVWIGSVNKWIAIYAINELCNIFPTKKSEVPYANKYYEKFLKNEQAVMQGDFFNTNNVEWQFLWKRTPLVILRLLFYLPGRWLLNKLGGNNYVTPAKYYKELEDKQSMTGGGMKKIPLGPRVMDKCLPKDIGKEETAEVAGEAFKAKNVTYFPYNLFKKVCLYNNGDSESLTCNDDEEKIKYLNTNAKTPEVLAKDENRIYRRGEIQNIFKVLWQKWVNGYVIATITSWIIMREGVTKVTESLNNHYSGGAQYLKFFGISLFKIAGLIGVAGLGIVIGLWSYLKGTIKSKTIFNPILSIGVCINYVCQILSGIVTFLFFPLFQAQGFKQCWCIFKNNWKSILMAGLISFALFTGFDKEHFGWGWAGSFIAIAIVGAFILGGIDIKAIKALFSKSPGEEPSINCESKDPLNDTECPLVLEEIEGLMKKKK